MKAGLFSSTCCSDLANALELELSAFMDSIPPVIEETGCPHELSKPCATGCPHEQLAHDLDEAVNGDGTASQPFDPPERGTVPLSDFKTHGYTMLAFPTLFPFGTGDFSEKRSHALSYEQYSQHLMNFHDGRFARHARFPYFWLNTHERQAATTQVHESNSLIARRRAWNASIM